MSIEVKDICYLYDAGTAFEKDALSHVSFTINKGEFVGIIGHTGSGKSTLIQHLNALLTPSSGKIYIDGLDVFDPEAKSRRKEIRRKVGLVFQYPEHQLFETTVWKDVSFGPVNMKLPQEEVEKRVKWAMDKVGLGPDYYEKSPFDLSGGQKRRVALAGVLAMQPEYLVLDEPTAGLDPRGRDELFESIASLCRDVGIAVILVSHSMEDVARYVDRLLVMDHGHLRFDDTPANVFSHKDELEAMGLEVPQIAYLGYLLRQNGYPIPENIIKMNEMEDALVQLFGTKEARHDS